MGASSIKMISGTKKKSSFAVERMVIVPLPYRAVDERGVVNVEAVTQAMETAFAELGLTKPALATSVRGSGVFTKRVTIPKIPKKEIPDQVRWEAEQVFPQDINNIVVDYVLLGEGTNVPGAPPGTKGWDLMLVGAQAQDCATLRDLLEASGAAVKVMDLDSFGLSDFLDGFVNDRDHAAMFVDVGAAGTRIGIRSKGQLVFVREFPIGGNAFTEAIAQAVGLSFENAEALKTQSEGGVPQEALDALSGVFGSWKVELQQCEDVYVSQGADQMVGEYHLLGGGAQTPGLFDTLKSERIGDKLFYFPAHEVFRAKGKVDSGLLQAWAPRLLSAAAMSLRKG